MFIMVYMLSPELVESDGSTSEMIVRITKHRRELDVLLQTQLTCRTGHDGGSRGPPTSRRPLRSQFCFK